MMSMEASRRTGLEPANSGPGPPATPSPAASHQGPLGPAPPSRNTPHGQPVLDGRAVQPSVSSMAPAPPRVVRVSRALAWFLADQWFLLAMGVLVIISSQVQVSAGRQRVKAKIVTYLCVAVIFFITGCTLDTATLVKNYARWKVHAFVQVQCFLVTSATTFAIVSACATNPTFMDPWLLIGLIFLGCVPTTISAGVIMTKQAHGNQELTVVESTLGNFLGPLLTPPLVNLYTSTGAWYTRVLPSNTGDYSAIYRRVFMQLGFSLYLPMFIGQLVRNAFPRACQRVFVDWKVSKLGPLALLVIVWQAFDQAFETGAFESVKGSNIVFVVFVSVGLYWLWLFIAFGSSVAWLPKVDTTAVCYCVPPKTPALGLPLITTLYVGISELDQSKIQMPIVIYQALQLFFGSLSTMAFRRWMRPEGVQAAAEHKHGDERPSATP